MGTEFGLPDGDRLTVIAQSIPELLAALDIEAVGNQAYELVRRLYPVTRSITGAPEAMARAAEDGLSRLSAALAYFSKGT